MTVKEIIRYEIHLTEKEERMFIEMSDWIAETLNCTDDCDAPELPEEVITILSNLLETIGDLYALCPEEH